MNNPKACPEQSRRVKIKNEKITEDEKEDHWPDP
jgi:hypothetical protein